MRVFQDRKFVYVSCSVDTEGKQRMGEVLSQTLR